MTGTRITRENIHDFKVGTPVTCNWGAYYPTEEGVVVDYHVTPPSKWFPEKCELEILLDSGQIHRTNMIVEKGIGTKLQEAYFGS